MRCSGFRAGNAPSPPAAPTQTSSSQQFPHMVTRSTLQKAAALHAHPATCPWLRHRRSDRRMPSRGCTSLAPTCTIAPLPPRNLSAIPRPKIILPLATEKVASKAKLRVVVLGSGWGAISMLTGIDPKAFDEDGDYELTLISTGNYFLFTPLLPSAMSGTVEERSLVCPIRNLILGKGEFYEATCVEIDPKARMLTCQRQQDEDTDTSKASSQADLFQVPYDMLIFSCGSVNNTFGIPGVREHCFFMKTLEDADFLRKHISKAIELAGVPNTTPEARRRMLQFVVVGGGPTGVEVAAELQDLVVEDVARLFPSIVGDVSITVVDCLDKVLSSFQDSVSSYASRLLSKEGIQLKLGSTIQAVTDSCVVVKHKDGVIEELPYGTCVWATGVAAHPLANSLRQALGEAVQGDRRGLLVDSHLRVLGSEGTILALGDAAVTNQVRAAGQAAALFTKGGANHGSRLSRRELLDLLSREQETYPQLGDLLLHLDGGLLRAAAQALFPNSPAQRVAAKYMAKIQEGLALEEFKELLADVDSTLPRALPPTALVARQQGEYLASLFSRRLVQRAPAAAPSVEEAGWAAFTPPPVAHLSRKASPFTYVHLGSLAYLGMNRAVMQLPTAFPVTALKGFLAAHIWRALELYMQVSDRNRWMVWQDWLHVKFFGRNISDA